MADPGRPRLDELVRRLEQAAAMLRGDDLGAERAAAVVEECARLAAAAAAELDRELRAAEAGAAAPGQLSLGGGA